MVEIIWKEPPPAVSPEKQAILAELKKNPGRWALVKQDATSSGAHAPWQKLGCEAKACRKNHGENPPRYEIYARWPERKPEKPRPEPDVPVVRPAGAGTYDPGLGRAARGVPESGLPLSSLAPRRLADRPQA